MMHCAARPILWLPVHARGRAHSGGHLLGHAAHIGAHARAVGPGSHLPRAHSTWVHPPIWTPAALGCHGVHRATHARAGVVGIRHASITRSPGITWRGRRDEQLYL